MVSGFRGVGRLGPDSCWGGGGALGFGLLFFGGGRGALGLRGRV